MKRLTLLRHAKTETQHSGQEDWDRELEPRGQKDAPEMARRLRERKLKPDRIVTSPAVRALATANIFARELHVPAAKLVQDVRHLHAGIRPRAVERARVGQRRECGAGLSEELLVSPRSVDLELDAQLGEFRQRLLDHERG